MFKQLLNDIIPENIGHELQRIRLDFGEYLILFITISSFQLLLNEAGSVLVSTELYNMIVDISELISFVILVVHAEFFQQGTFDNLWVLRLSALKSWRRWETWRAEEARYSVWIGQRVHAHSPRISRKFWRGRVPIGSLEGVKLERVEIS